MKNTLFLYLSQRRIFWWFRKILFGLIFWTERNLYESRDGLKEENNNFKFLLNILSLTKKPLFIAIGLALVLQCIDPLLINYYKKIGFVVAKDGDYVTFLAAIASIGSVFIGLYYTGISAVGGAIYSRVPNDIRGLLAHERFGNVYMRFLSFLTFLCIVLIALSISGQPKIYLSLPIITISAGIGIFAFVKLGQRAFNLFDPTALSGHIFEQMQNWLEMVKVGGLHCMDNSFQHHAHRSASRTLDTLETLADLTAKESHLNGTPFVNLSKNILRFQIKYEYSKKYIPTASRWYEQKYQHRDWYRTDDTRVSIAHQTGTSIDPEVTSNNEWIEARTLKIIISCIQINIKSKKYLLALDLINTLEDYISTLADVRQLDKAISLIVELARIVIESMTIDSLEQQIDIEVLEKLTVVEKLASFPIILALRYRHSIQRINRHDIETQISSVKWDADRSIYRLNFHTYTLSRLEWLQKKLAFEVQVEGSPISPIWYQMELILQVEAENFTSSIDSLITKVGDYFVMLIEIATSRKRPWLAAAVMSLELEYWNKLEHQFDLWSHIWEDLSKDKKIEGLPWPAFDLDVKVKESKNRLDQLMEKISRQNILLAALNRQDGFPDYAGQFLHTAGESALNAILNNDLGLFKKIFKSYLLGCMSRFESLRPKNSKMDYKEINEFKIASASLLDLMDISGFAKLLADYHDNQSLWLEVTKCWDDFLRTHQNQSLIQLFNAVISVTDLAFEIPHRGILRTTWHQKISKKISSKSSDIQHYEVNFEVDHESALVRIFANNPYGSNYDGIDIFIAYYFRNLNVENKLDFGKRRRDLQDSLEREKVSYEKRLYRQ